LSDLAKYSMTQSIARSLCNSWAACVSYVAFWTFSRAERNNRGFAFTWI